MAEAEEYERDEFEQIGMEGGKQTTIQLNTGWGQRKIKRVILIFE